MAIYKGNKEIVGLYKGLTEIIKRYKGSNLIYNVFKWLPYSYEHIYNSLVPSVINNKNVKEKAQVKTIYGNSVAENQLVPNDKIEQVITFETTDTNPKAIVNIDFIVGHKYLITCEQSATLSSNTRNTFTIGANYETTQSNANLQKGIRKWIYTHSGDGTALYIWCHSPNIQVSFTNFNIIDLNQWFPFNTPTTLTDPRVQEIINRGHILYNAGTLKNVDIGEISSEPYNLFDEALEIGSIREDNGQNNDNITGVSRSKNYIKVVPGYSYTLEYPTTANLIIYEYDENNGYIESYSTSSTTSVSITLTNITRYVRFAIGNNDLTAKVCFHIAGTRTGYSPHTQSYTLPFKYQGSGVGTAHDTLEITDTEYVFTKNITEDNLSNYAFYYADSTKFLYTTRELNGCRTDSIWSPNALTNISGYKLVDSNKLSDNDVACTIYTGKFYIRNDALTEQQLKDVIANKTIKYQLATPQVVRIPKKHLAAVDLGTLNWVYNSGLFYVALKGIKKALSYDAIPNLCCSKYLTASKRQIDNGSPDKIIGTSDNIEYIYIIDSDYTDATTFKQAMSGVYLFYETEAEVEDIDFEIGVEAGGTLTSNLFSWVENQQTDFTVDFVTKSVNGITIETDLTKKTIRYYGTASANATCGFISSSNDKNNLTVGHKYLLKLNKIGNSGNSKCSVVGLNSSWLDIQDNIYTGIAASQYGQVIIYSGEQVDFTIQYQIIDLTHGFGAGNEPTSINDPRIQYIIKQGYIQTNTTGTNKSVASEVLPNIGFKIKCR